MTGCGLVVALGLALVAPAQTKLPSTVTIRFDQSGAVEKLRGKVRSPEPRCKRRRKVLVYGDSAEDDVKVIYLLGYDRADRRGRWWVTTEDRSPIRPGHYFARIKGKRVPGGRCLPDRSRVIAVRTSADSASR